MACPQATKPVRLQRYVVIRVVSDERLLLAGVRSRAEGGGARTKERVGVSVADARRFEY